MAKLTKRQWTSPDGAVKEAWRVDYKDAHGVRRAKQFARKVDADTYRKRIERELDDGTHLAPSDSPTLADAAERWIEACSLRNWKTSTAKQMRQHVDHISRRSIGRVKLSKLTHETIERFAIELVEDTSRPLAKKILTTLKAILRKAKRGHLVDDVKIKGNATRKLEVGKDIPTPAEVRAIIEHSKGKWRVVNILAAFTGLRASELRGLRWSDVDLEGSRLHVRQRADMWREISEPKSETSERVIPIGPMVVNTLRAWKVECTQCDLGLVFPSNSGNVLAGTKLPSYALWPPQVDAGLTVPATYKDGRPKLDANGQPKLQAKYQGMHTLRHFFASWCVNRPADGGLGLPPKTVQERLGHSDIRITMNTYSHLFPSDDGAELEAGELALMRAV